MTPYWDYTWDYTMGLPGANGWIKTTSGSPKEVLTSTHLETSAANGASIKYEAPSGASVSKGVMEVVFNTAQPSSSTQLAQFRLGNSTYCLFVIVTGDGCLRFWDNTTTSKATVVYNGIQNRVYYTVRLVLNESVGEIYVDGTKVATVDTTKSVYKGATRFAAQNTGSVRAYWQSVKVRLGRI